MKLILFAAALALLPASSAFAQGAGDIVINAGLSTNCVSIPQLTGFPALSWTIGGANNVTFSGPSGTAGKVALNDLTVSRRLDICSEALIKNFLVGQTFQTLTLTQYEGGGGATPAYAYMVVTLSNAVVNGYSVGGSNSADPAETVSFGYSKLCVQTTAQNADGSLKPPTNVCYNLSTNQTQ